MRTLGAFEFIRHCIDHCAEARVVIVLTPPTPLFPDPAALHVHAAQSFVSLVGGRLDEVSHSQHERSLVGADRKADEDWRTAILRVP
jgi:hypothetical protein